MSTTSGWGRFTWGQANWNEDTTLKTGWGAQAWNGAGGWGDLSDQTITLDGQSLTTSLGSSSIRLDSTPTITDQEITSSLGSSSVQVDFSGTLTDQEATSSVGSLVTEVSYELSGQQASTTLGTVTHGIGVPLEMVADPPTGDQLLKFARTSVGSVSVALEEIVTPTGLESTFATPTLSYAGTLVGWGRDEWGDLSWGESPNQVITLVGIDATASVGSISPADAVGVSGQEATTNVGSTTFTINSTPDITGQEATANLGTLGLEFGPAAISGVSASFNVGTLGLEFGPPSITGVLAETAVGELTIDDAQIINVTVLQLHLPSVL